MNNTIKITHVPNPNRKIFSLPNTDIDFNVLAKTIKIKLKAKMQEVNIHDNHLYIEKISSIDWEELTLEICGQIFKREDYIINNCILTEEEIQTQSEQLYLETKEGLECLTNDLRKII